MVNDYTTVNLQWNCCCIQCTDKFEVFSCFPTMAEVDFWCIHVVLAFNWFLTQYFCISQFFKWYCRTGYSLKSPSSVFNLKPFNIIILFYNPWQACHEVIINIILHWWGSHECSKSMDYTQKEKNEAGTPWAHLRKQKPTKDWWALGNLSLAK